MVLVEIWWETGGFGRNIVGEGCIYLKEKCVAGYPVYPT